MAFCTNCGASLEDGKAFCPNCGTQVAAPAAPESANVSATHPAAPPTNGIPEQPATSAPYADARQPIQTNPTAGNGEIPADPNDVKENKVMAVLAYFGLLVLIPILAAKESPYARYHSNQGLILLICWIVAYILGRIWGLLGTIGNIVCFVFFIMGIVNAVKGRMKPLPGVGSIKLLK